MEETLRKNIHFRLSLLNEEIDQLNALQKNFQSLSQYSKSQNSDLSVQFSHDSGSRYSRQLIVDYFGPENQLELMKLSVLIVGAGGLGCPCAMYLAGAGVGKLGILDDDVIDKSNLHRQVAHKSGLQGISKSKSLVSTCIGINPTIDYVCLEDRLTESNAIEIFSDFDVIVDATDNPGSRYLINDVAVIVNKPVVFAASVGTNGQLSLFHHRDGPCYRCIFPAPPPLETVSNCADNGVLGPVVGTMGCLQALEVLRFVHEFSLSRKKSEIGAPSTPTGDMTTSVNRLLVFDGEECRFRSVTLRGKDKNCLVCGIEPQIKTPFDSKQWIIQNRVPSAECVLLKPSKYPDLPSDLHVPVEILCDFPRNIPEEFRNFRGTFALVDVRPANHTSIVNVRAAKCVDLLLIEAVENRYKQKLSKLDFGGINTDSGLSEADAKELMDMHARELIDLYVGSDSTTSTSSDLKKDLSNYIIFFLCRRGNDSILATLLSRRFGIRCYNVQGGLQAYQRAFDPLLPMY